NRGRGASQLSGLKRSLLRPFLFLLLDSVDQIARKKDQIAKQKQAKGVRTHNRKLNVGVMKDDGEDCQDNRDQQCQLCRWCEPKRHVVPPQVKKVDGLDYH